MSNKVTHYISYGLMAYGGIGILLDIPGQVRDFISDVETNNDVPNFIIPDTPTTFYNEILTYWNPHNIKLLKNTMIFITGLTIYNVAK